MNLHRLICYADRTYPSILVLWLFVALAAHGVANEKTKLPGMKVRVSMGWKSTGTSRITLARFSINEKSNTQVTITALRKPVGDWADYRVKNVNRWRTQLGLPTETKVGVESHLKKVVTDKHVSDFVEIAGMGKRILVVMTVRADKVWFFKMMGPDGEVAEHKHAFSEFVTSVEFTTEPADE